ncbi:DUF4142 domain-containing protein [Catellatospora sp. NPDC049609]|uniref:DUF4142 domain-containing protein n=1 Tax=Catellatospora sp. NPDC049609 TaxID=3155505 RepID=UPI00343DFD1D
MNTGRIFRAATLTAVALLALAPAAGPVAAADDLPAGWTANEFGPLGPADRDLLVRVRLAGLWEAPAGRQAQERAGDQRIKDVGHHLETDHLALDVEVRRVAARLGVALPDKPNAEQQGWLDEFSTLRGDAYDRVWIARLRAAHGKVFGVVAGVRAGTRNEVIREFAQQAVTVVMKHMTLLESTGMVDYATLPAAPTPAAAPVAAARNRVGGPPQPLIWLVLAAALAVGTVTATRVWRPR